MLLGVVDRGVVPRSTGNGMDSTIPARGGVYLGWLVC